MENYFVGTILLHILLESWWTGGIRLEILQISETVYFENILFWRKKVILDALNCQRGSHFPFFFKFLILRSGLLASEQDALNHNWAGPCQRAVLCFKWAQLPRSKSSLFVLINFILDLVPKAIFFFSCVAKNLLHFCSVWNTLLCNYSQFNSYHANNFFLQKLLKERLYKLMKRCKCVLQVVLHRKH